MSGHGIGATDTLPAMVRVQRPDAFRWRGLANQNPGGLSLWELIREDFGAHGRVPTPGFRAIAVHRFGNWCKGVHPRVLRSPLDLLYRWMQRRVVRRHGIQLEYAAEIGRRVVIDHQNGILVQSLSRIGDGCRLRHNVTIGRRRSGDATCPVLGSNVDVGVGAVILGEVHVGDDAVIGANAVVVEDVPSGALAVGIPARIVRRAAPDHDAVRAESCAATTDGSRDDSGELAVVDVR